MIRRTTVSARVDDLLVLRAEARRRRLSLARLLQEVVREAAERERARRPQPSVGIFASGDATGAQQTVDDEDAPARGRLRS